MTNPAKSILVPLFLCLSACSTSEQEATIRTPTGGDIAEVYDCGLPQSDAHSEAATLATASRTFIVSPHMRVWVIEGGNQWAESGIELELENVCHGIWPIDVLRLFGERTCRISSSSLRYYRSGSFLGSYEIEIRMDLRARRMHYRELNYALGHWLINLDYESQCQLVGHVRLLKLEDGVVRILDRYKLNQNSET